MASYTQEIKKELLTSVPSTHGQRRAAFAALLHTGASFGGGRVEFASENERIAEYFVSLSEYFLIPVMMDGAEYDVRNGKDRLRFCLEESERVQEIVNTPVEEFIQESDCALFYLKAAFLGGGSCLLPKESSRTGYHLEFVFSSARRADDFCYLMDSLSLWGRTVKRGDKQVVYLKSRESISDFLSVAGVTGALGRLERVSASREENNFVNRVGNCMARNADRAISASAKQAYLISRFKERGGFETLPSTLKELALLRLDNPTLSLSELGEVTGLSKSCLNHRMRRLMEIVTVETP